MADRHSLRTDIQALRGLAILLVLFHHGSEGVLAAGYLGVDVFFVVSGFLITGIVARAIVGAQFSFADFYTRRARRLLPAAYACFAVVALCAPFVLDSLEFADFRAQLWGALSFTGNLVLWRQTGYFEGAAFLKPLLHVWSLGIEEQCYLLLPASLWLTPRRWWGPAAIAVLSGSLALCLWLAPGHPSAAFYLLPTRAWELALGSIGALYFADRAPGVALRWAFWPALAALLVVPVRSFGSFHPGLDAVLVCAATFVVILRAHPALERNMLSRAFAWVGGFSYSLYLVHWPLFAFANSLYATPVPPGVRGALAVIALLLGYVLFAAVERPMRRSNLRLEARTLPAILAVTLAIGLIPAWSARLAPSPVAPDPTLRAANFGLSAQCEGGAAFAADAACRTSARPTMLVWGDSFAMHLVPGLQASGASAIAQATRSACAPATGLATLDGAAYGEPWARDCIAFNDSVLAWLRATPSVRVVALSSPFGQLVDPRADGNPGLLERSSDGELIAIDRGHFVALRHLLETVQAIRALGRRVVVVSPPPSAGFDIGRCLERRRAGKPVLGAATDCRVRQADFHAQRAAVLALLASAQQGGAPIFNFEPALCSGGWCSTQEQGVPLYRDEGHFSRAGSVLLGRRLGLATRLTRMAR